MKAKEILDHMLANRLDAISLRLKNSCNYNSYSFREISNMASIDDDTEFFTRHNISISGSLYGTLSIFIETNNKESEKSIKEFAIQTLNKLDKSIKNKFDSHKNEMESLEKKIKSLNDEIESEHKKLLDARKQFNNLSQQVSTLFTESILLQREITIKKAKIYSQLNKSKHDRKENKRQI
jgi:chromosome segregation ATPase